MPDLDLGMLRTLLAKLTPDLAIMAPENTDVIVALVNAAPSLLAALDALTARVEEVTRERDRLKVMVEDYDLAFGKSKARVAALVAALEQHHQRKHTTHIPGGVIAPGPKGPTFMHRAPEMRECQHALCQAALAAARGTA